MFITVPLARFFDLLYYLWEKHATERAIGLFLICIYPLTLLAVELGRFGLYPDWLPRPPDSLFFAINLSFSVILGLEIVSLVFIMPASLSRGMGKQLEILTLILLRNAFKELPVLSESIAIDLDNIFSIIDIAVSGLGALCVFAFLGLYRKIIRPRNFNIAPELLQGYVRAKKILSLLLLIFFIGLLCHDIYIFFNGGQTGLFETMYTALIFADIAMVLIAQRYMPGYYAVFRNSAFVIGTLLMRLALSAPIILCSFIAMFAAIYIYAVTCAANYFEPE